MLIQVLVPLSLASGSPVLSGVCALSLLVIALLVWWGLFVSRKRFAAPIGFLALLAWVITTIRMDELLRGMSV